jgi:hypothetical protein
MLADLRHRKLTRSILTCHGFAVAVVCSDLFDAFGRNVPAGLRRQGRVKDQ